MARRFKSFHCIVTFFTSLLLVTMVVFWNRSKHGDKFVDSKYRSLDAETTTKEPYVYHWSHDLMFDGFPATNFSCNPYISLNPEDALYLLKEIMSEKAIINRTANCEEYFKTVRVSALQKENEVGNTSLAFSHLLHKDVGIFEIFLAVMYR